MANGSNPTAQGKGFSTKLCPSAWESKRRSHWKGCCSRAAQWTLAPNGVECFSFPIPRCHRYRPDIIFSTVVNLARRNEDKHSKSSFTVKNIAVSGWKITAWRNMRATSTSMVASQIAESQSNAPAVFDSAGAHQAQESSIVSDSWQQTVQAVLGVILLLGAFAMVHYYSPTAALALPPSDPTLQKQVYELTVQVEQLQQDQAMPAVVLNRYPNSIGYIYGVYQVSFANQRPVVRARVSGT